MSNTTTNVSLSMVAVTGNPVGAGFLHDKAAALRDTIWHLFVQLICTCFAHIMIIIKAAANYHVAYSVFQ